LNGQQITPLAAVGECAISVTSAGNATAAPVTVILPIRLTVGAQTLGSFALAQSLKAYSKTNLPTETNFGEKVTYKAVGSCSVVRSVLTMRKGKCEISATSKARKGLYEALNLKLTTTSK
jgi:hypothetical protein